MSALRLTYFLCLSALAILLVPICSAQQQNTGIDAQIEVSKLTGCWTGALDVGAVRLRLVFNLTSNGEKTLATLDSPDQGAKGIPLDEVALNGRTINIAIQEDEGRVRRKAQ